MGQGVAAVIAASFAGWVVGFSDWSLGASSLENWGLLMVALSGAAFCYVGVALLFRDEQAGHWLNLFQRGLARARRGL